MDLETFKANYYLFDKNKYTNIYSFVDFGNVRPWAKDLWTDENKHDLQIEVDIEKLADICRWVDSSKKFFYYGYYKKRLDLPAEHKLNIQSRNSIFRLDKARKAGFLVKTKEIKMIPHYNEDGLFSGKTPKCNFDVEITMSMLTKIKKYDTIMLFSGDSDFGELLGYLKEKGKKIVVICTRDRMSNELENVADIFVPAETLKSFLKFDIKNTPPQKGTEE